MEKLSIVWPVRFKPGDFERIKAVARQEDRSIGGYLRWAAIRASREALATQQEKKGGRRDVPD